MEATTMEYKLSLQSTPANIAEVEPFVEKIKNALNIGDEVYGNILITLTEAVNNSILHGNESIESREVEITCTGTDKMVSFFVKDQGEGFNYNNLPDPTDPENLHKLTGRGVFLMKQLSDTLIFSNSGSMVELQFKL